MADPAFLEMRAGLVERGLLAEDFTLTPAGDAYAAELIDELKVAEAPCDPDRARVRWTYQPRRAA